MVTKHKGCMEKEHLCLILAKIHMVTKLVTGSVKLFVSLILAKIHMVTKQLDY